MALIKEAKKAGMQFYSEYIAINNYMTNYYEAIEFANRNYVCEET